MNGDNANNTSRQTGMADLVIIGGGIMGLWAAYHAEKAGIDTLLIDRAVPGGGTSNGLLGALMAYMPDQWDEKKQFQFEALVALEQQIGMLEAETGIATGYRRAGRIMPLYNDRQVKTARLREDAAAQNWRIGERSFDWTVVETPPLPGWRGKDENAIAYVHETLAAHVFPRGVVAALTAFLRAARHVRIMQASVAGIDVSARRLRLADGQGVGFGKVIVSAGVEAFSLLQPLWAPEGQPLGRPVKGQAALLQADCDPALPIMFDNGLYVIAHEGGRVAVGSTSEDEFDDAFATDDRLETLIAAARAAIPALRDAPVIERWAGLRPRGVHREPMIGAIEGVPDVVALGGGFKTSFAIAGRLAAHAIALVSDNTPALQELPAIYNPGIYLQRANRKTK